MRKKTIIFILFFLSGFFLLYSNEIKPKHLPSKPLQDLSGKELNLLFREANLTYKAESFEQFASQMRYKLNGSMMIAQGNQVFTEKAYGYLQLYKSSKGYGRKSYNQLASLRRQEANKMTTGTLFDLASVSKQFTAAAVLKLCEQHKLKLSDTLGTFFPELPYGTVTIHQLLTHTTGIPEYFDFSYTVYDTAYYVDNLQLIRILSEKKLPKVFPSGSKFAYCNTNYAILAAIVAKVSGMRFEQFVHQYLWQPAGMTNTDFFTELDSLRAQNGNDIKVARGHWANGAFAVYDRLNGILGDKGVYSNAEDLLKWTNAYFIDHTIVSEEWVNKATERENTLNDGQQPKAIYGYGFRIEKNPYFGTLIYHGGLWNGFQNLYLYRPEDHLTIIFLSNYYNCAHRGKSNEVLYLMDGA